jgi:hypothetical protein
MVGFVKVIETPCARGTTARPPRPPTRHCAPDTWQVEARIEMPESNARVPSGVSIPVAARQSTPQRTRSSTADGWFGCDRRKAPRAQPPVTKTLPTASSREACVGACAFRGRYTYTIIMAPPTTDAATCTETPPVAKVVPKTRAQIPIAARVRSLAPGWRRRGLRPLIAFRATSGGGIEDSVWPEVITRR